MVILAGLFAARGIQAANEVQYVLQGSGSTVVPTFVPGHEGDFNKVTGFLVAGDIYFNGSKIGSYDAEVILANPPVNNSPYQYGMMLSSYTFPGLGTIDATSQTLLMSSSTTPMAGDVVFAWMGSLSNGTGSLADAYALTSGTGISKLVHWRHPIHRGDPPSLQLLARPARRPAAWWRSSAMCIRPRAAGALTAH
jgi:hypothetical protein